MEIPFITTGELSPYQIVGAYAAVVGVWFAMAAMLGYSARIFVGADGVNLFGDAALAFLGAIFVTALMRHFEFSIADWIINHSPRGYADLAGFAELAAAAFFGACGLRLVFDLR